MGDANVEANITLSVRMAEWSKAPDSSVKLA